MKINIVKESPKELKLEIEGVGHTFCNLMQKKLLEDKNVDFAGYDIPHPLDSNPVIYLRTVGEISPEKILQKAVERARNMNEEFKKKLQKTLET